MEKELLSNKKNIYILLRYFVFISFFISCKKERGFVYDANSIMVDPMEKIIKIKKVKEIEIFKTDSLGQLDSTSLRKYYINPFGLIETLEDKPAFSITLKIGYDDANLPSSLYCLSDYLLEYTSVNKADSTNKRITTFWKDEFNKIEDSTIYFFNTQNQLIKVNNSIDLFNHFIRKKIGNGVFKINFNEELFYKDDSLLSEKKIVYKFKENTNHEKYFPVNSTVKYSYDTKQNIIKVTEDYVFLNKQDNIRKEIFFKNGLPSYQLINNKEKFVYNYILYK